MPLPAGACRLVARTSRLIGKKEEAALRLAGGQLASLRSLPLASLAQGHSVVRCQVEVLRLLRDQNVAELQLEVVQHNRCACWAGAGWGGLGKMLGVQGGLSLRCGA